MHDDYKRNIWKDSSMILLENLINAHMGRINQERKNDPLGSLYSELWQLGTI